MLVKSASIPIAAAILIMSLLHAAATELAGTSWQLVEIASMNDTVERPDDASKYTLSFGEDGTASIQADCNRGKGSWTSESKSQLQFGDIASTRALCPPGSISEKYLAEFQWVRSYVMEDGHLFLATMADGSIIEFEPVDKVAATVFGEVIRGTDMTELQEEILGRVFDRYAAENGIEANQEEIDAYLEKMDRGMAAEGLTAEDDLTADEVVQVRAMRQGMARSMIRQWKINKSLYETYGGRIIYQQLGPEPLDAYREHLENLEKTGALSIENEALKTAFWRYFTDEAIHDFMATGSDDEKRAFSVTPWSSAD